MDVLYFTNDRYKVLVCIQERQINEMGNKYVSVSQRKISEITKISYRTVNNTIKDLRNNGYIAMQGTTRGKYSLASKAISTLAMMQGGGVQQ